MGHTQHNLRFGSLALTTGGQTQTATGTINHPDYNPVNLNNDISIIPIPTPLTFTDAIQYIRLPTAGQVGSTFLDVQGRVSGWGATSPDSGASMSLNWVNQRIIANTECAAIFGGAVVVGHVVCSLGWDSPVQSHCAGDSGKLLNNNESSVIILTGFPSGQVAH